MKFFKFGLRIWITIASLVVFTGSWMVFSHSPKPDQWPVNVPTLEPLPPMPSSSNSESGGIFSSLQQSVFRPRSRSMFVTGGS
jgi:hypothetical protein